MHDLIYATNVYKIRLIIFKINLFIKVQNFLTHLFHPTHALLWEGGHKARSQHVPTVYMSIPPRHIMMSLSNIRYGSPEVGPSLSSTRASPTLTCHVRTLSLTTTTEWLLPPATHTSPFSTILTPSCLYPSKQLHMSCWAPEIPVLDVSLSKGSARPALSGDKADDRMASYGKWDVWFEVGTFGTIQWNQLLRSCRVWSKWKQQA